MAEATGEVKFLSIPITKAKITIDVDVSESGIPAEVYQRALEEGLKVLLNGGMTKITKNDCAADAKRRNVPVETVIAEEATAKATENLANLMEGKLPRKGRASTKVKGVPREVMTEARRLAKVLVKAEIKRQNKRIGDYDASEITKAANGLLEDAEQGPLLFAEAQANLEAANAKAVKINVASIAVSDKKVKAAAARKKEKGEQLSAKQAGKVQTRAKPEARATH